MLRHLYVCFLICLFSAANTWATRPTAINYAPINYTHEDVAYVTDIDWPPDRIKPGYTKHLSVYGVDILGTRRTGTWAMIKTHSVIKHMINALKPEYRSKFIGYKVIVINANDQVAKLPYLEAWQGDVENKRGGSIGTVTLVTEEMMCKTGVISRPEDNRYREFDQVVHEWGHTIENALNMHYATDAAYESAVIRDVNAREYFSAIIQRWYLSHDFTDGIDDRETMKIKDPVSYNLLSSIFSEELKWSPLCGEYNSPVYSSPYRHKSIGNGVEVTQFALANDIQVPLTLTWLDFNGNSVGNRLINSGSVWEVKNGAKTWETHVYGLYYGNAFLCSFWPSNMINTFVSQLEHCPLFTYSSSNIERSVGKKNEVTQFSLMNDTQLSLTIKHVDFWGNMSPGTTVHPNSSWGVFNGGRTWESHAFAVYSGNQFLCSFKPRQNKVALISRLTQCPFSTFSSYRKESSTGTGTEVTRFSLLNNVHLPLTVKWIDFWGNPAEGVELNSGAIWHVDNGGRTWESHAYGLYSGDTFLCSFKPRQNGDVIASRLTQCPWARTRR